MILAIYYWAQTINYILNKLGYNGCGCTGENSPPGGQNPNPPVGDDVKVKEGVKIALRVYIILIFFFN